MASFGRMTRSWATRDYLAWVVYEYGYCRTMATLARSIRTSAQHEEAMANLTGFASI